MSTLVEAGPLHRTCPPWSETSGGLAAETGADLGLTPDPEQRWLLDAIYAESAPGTPAAPEVCVVAPRQNLKSAALEIAALHDLYVVGVDLAVWTAHEFKTARKSFEDMRKRILANPDYAGRTQFRDSHGEEAIFLDTGERLEFHARSGGSGRGFTCRRLTLDEWMYGREGDLGALGPTLFTIPDAQVRYGSSAGKVESTALRGLRERGRVGDPSLAYAEYGAPRKACEDERCLHYVGAPGCALDDRDLWWAANCALWAGRATLESVARQRGMLSPREFMREFLSWWEDPVSIGGALDFDLWSSVADPDAPRGTDVVFGLDLDESRQVSIGVGWVRPDGSAQVMVAESGLSSARALERVVELHGQWGGSVAVGGPADALEADLVAKGVPVVPVSGAEFAQACGALADRMTAGTLRHGNQPVLNDSVKGARWRSVGTAGERAWQLKGAAGIGPLAAVTRALHGLSNDGPSVYETRGPLTL